MPARAYASASWVVSDYDDSEGKIGDATRLQQGSKITDENNASVTG
jgi:hypothetical protein